MTTGILHKVDPLHTTHSFLCIIERGFRLHGAAGVSPLRSIPSQSFSSHATLVNFWPITSENLFDVFFLC